MKRDLELLRSLMFEHEENYWERGQLARIRLLNKTNAGEPPALPGRNSKELVYVTE